MNSTSSLFDLDKKILFFMAVFSILSALFMPAMFTFYTGLPLFVLSSIGYISYRAKDIRLFIKLAIVIIGLTIVSIGILYILAFTIFINLFPTFVVIVVTLLLVSFMPSYWSKYKKISFGFSISLLLGLNTTIFNILVPAYNIQESIHEKLAIHQKDIVRVSDNSSYPALYNPYDFLSFGANEGCGCGYWEEPKIENGDIKSFLRDREVSYAVNKDLPKKIEVNYVHIRENLFHLTVDVKSNNKIVSSLKITDKMPSFNGMGSSGNLEDLNYRIEFLQRHNIWHAVLYYFFPIERNLAKIINQFLDKSIDVQFEKPKNWSKNISNLSTRLVNTTEMHECSNSQNDDDYKDYQFNQWSKQNLSNIDIKFLPENILIIKYDGIIYSTRLYPGAQTNWNDYKVAYVSEKEFFVTRYPAASNETIVFWQFSNTGDFIRELHFTLPTEIAMQGRTWHPISHIAIKNNTMQFRIYEIHEKQQNDKKNMCKYYTFEVVNRSNIKF